MYQKGCSIPLAKYSQSEVYNNVKLGMSGKNQDFQELWGHTAMQNEILLAAGSGKAVFLVTVRNLTPACGAFA